jgi:hypothetical protein
LSFHDELEKWIITYLVTHSDESINTDLIVDNAPRTLINQINSDNELFQFLMNMEHGKGIIRRKYYTSFELTTQGKLYFRKFIEPLFIIAKNKKLYTQIIDQTEGKPDTKKRFKKILNSIKDELPDNAERILIKALTHASVELIFYLVKLIVTIPNAS